MLDVAADNVSVARDALETGDDVFHYVREEVHELELQICHCLQGQLYHLPVGDAISVEGARPQFLEKAHTPCLLDVAKARADLDVQFAQIPELLVLLRGEEVAREHAVDLGKKLLAVVYHAALVLGEPVVEHLEALFVRFRGFDNLGSLVDHMARVLAVHDVVQAQVHVGGVADDVEPLEHLSCEGMDDLLGCHGESPVLADVGLIVAMLPVGHAQDDDAVFLIQEKALAGNGLDGIFLICVHGYEGNLFHLWEMVRALLACVGGDGPVRLSEHTQHESLVCKRELACEHGSRGPAFAHNGKAVEFHEELVDKLPVARVALVVVAGKLSYAQSKALQDRVYVIGEGGEDAGQDKVVCRIAGQNVSPVHIEQIGHERRVVANVRQILFCKLLSEHVLMHTWQAREKGLHVAGKDLLFQKTGVGRDSCGVQDIVLEAFPEKGKLPVYGEHGESRQLLVLEHGVVEGGQKLAGLDQGIVGKVLVGTHKTHANVHGVKKGLEVFKAFHAVAIGKAESPGLPGHAVL